MITNNKLYTSAARLDDTLVSGHSVVNQSHHVDAELSPAKHSTYDVV